MNASPFYIASLLLAGWLTGAAAAEPPDETAALRSLDPPVLLRMALSSGPGKRH